MELKDSDQGSSSAKSNQALLLAKLDLMAAPSRVPKKTIAKACDLTAIELLMLCNLSQPWAKIENDAKERFFTPEMLERFLKVVFKRWNSTLPVPKIPREPRKRDVPDMSMVIGRWANDAPESPASENKRKREGKDESEVKASKARKLGARAWLAVSTENPEVLKFEFRDDDSRMVSQTKFKVEYLQGLDFESAKIEAMRVYDQAETARAEEFNTRLLLALARYQIVEFAKNGLRELYGDNYKDLL